MDQRMGNRGTLGFLISQGASVGKMAELCPLLCFAGQPAQGWAFSVQQN